MRAVLKRSIKMRSTNYYYLAAVLLPLFLLHCEKPVSYDLPPADPGNGGLRLPGGFAAVVVAEELPGQARHLAIRDNGDIYVNMRRRTPEGGNIALRDTDGDGKADVFKSFGHYRIHPVLIYPLAVLPAARSPY